MTKREIDLRVTATGVDIRKLPPGIYFGELRQDGELIGGKRITIYQ
jgi:hypothetical protein